MFELSKKFKKKMITYGYKMAHWTECLNLVQKSGCNVSMKRRDIPGWPELPKDATEKALK